MSVINDPNLKDIIEEYNTPDEEKVISALKNMDTNQIRKILYESGSIKKLSYMMNNGEIRDNEEQYEKLIDLYSYYHMGFIRTSPMLSIYCCSCFKSIYDIILEKKNEIDYDFYNLITCSNCANAYYCMECIENKLTFCDDCFKSLDGACIDCCERCIKELGLKIVKCEKCGLNLCKDDPRPDSIECFDEHECKPKN